MSTGEQEKGELLLRKEDEDLIQNILESHKDKPVLSNTDAFTETAQCFQEMGRYTEEIPNRHRNSKYSKFWRREAQRALQGFDAGHDRITGYHYWYLNFCPIERVIDKGEVGANGKKRTYRAHDFPDVWDSDYMFFHHIEEAENAGEHVNVLKTRRRGYSYKGAAMLCRNYFLIPRSKNYVFAGDGEYLTGADGILSKAWDIMDFVDGHTEYSKMRHYKNTEDHKRASYQVVEGGKTIEKGYKSEIVGVTLKDNPHRARGKAGQLILFEESGAFPGITTAWEIAKESVKQDDYVFGTLVAFGTGGEEGARFEGAENMFYNPDGYEIRPSRNIWDQGSLNGKRSCFFIPDYYNRSGNDNMDEHGNSLIENALRDIIKGRRKKERYNKDPAHMAQTKAEKPLTPQEAMMTMRGGFFPEDELRRRLSVLETNNELDMVHVGRLDWDPENPRGVEWRPDETGVQIIREYPLRNKSFKEGGIEIYEHPSEDPDGNVTGIYIAGMDTADDDDVENSSSLLSVFVMDALKRTIVAEYTGRPTKVKVFYDNMAKLLMYYDAKCNYENNKKGVFQHFENKAWTHLLCETPQTLKDKQMVSSNRSGNAAYGTPANQKVNNYALRLIREWLLDPAYGAENMDNVNTIRSKALLQELIKWDSGGNYDRVSAMGMLMLYEEFERRYLPTMDDTGHIEYDPGGSPEAQSDFFEDVRVTGNTDITG